MVFLFCFVLFFSKVFRPVPGKQIPNKYKHESNTESELLTNHSGISDVVDIDLGP